MSRMPTIVQIIPERGISSPFVIYTRCTRKGRERNTWLRIRGRLGEVACAVGGLVPARLPMDFVPDEDSSPVGGVEPVLDARSILRL